ncbi:MAG: hypothetical protein KGI35_16635, partial [Burkholderiales bacterium]|nr:hypothetical protein [Burkholderiales bacterium]
MTARQGPAAPTRTASAEDEQRWNRAALATPEPRRAARLWAYREAAVVLGRSQRGWLEPGASAAPPPAREGVLPAPAREGVPPAPAREGVPPAPAREGVPPAPAREGVIAAPARDGAPPVLLRDSGGGAVLVGPWLLGVSVLLPAADALAAGGTVASYRWLGELLAEALRAGGVEALAVSPQRLREFDAARAEPALDWACFGALSPWEVLV